MRFFYVSGCVGGLRFIDQWAMGRGDSSYLSRSTITSVALGIIVGSGAACAAYFLLHQSLLSTFMIGGGGALLTLALGKIACRTLSGREEIPQEPPIAQEEPEPQELSVAQEEPEPRLLSTPFELIYRNLPLKDFLQFRLICREYDATKFDPLILEKAHDLGFAGANSVEAFEYLKILAEAVEKGWLKGWLTEDNSQLTEEETLQQFIRQLEKAREWVREHPDSGGYPLQPFNFIIHHFFDQPEKLRLCLSHGARPSIGEWRYVAETNNISLANVLIDYLDPADLIVEGCNVFYTPLAVAALEGHMEMVRYLLAQQFSWREAIKSLLLPIIIFEEEQKVITNEARKAAICLLLEAGVNPNLPLDDGGNTLLHWIADPWHSYFFEVVPLLIEYGADINALNLWGKTPLAILVEQYPKPFIDEGIQIFLQNGADVKKQVLLNNRLVSILQCPFWYYRFEEEKGRFRGTKYLRQIEMLVKHGCEGDIVEYKGRLFQVLLDEEGALHFEEVLTHIFSEAGTLQ